MAKRRILQSSQKAKKAATKPDKSLASISALARACKPRLHRQTIVNRLQAAGIKPVIVKKKLTLYDRAQALAALSQPVSSDMDSTGLAEARRKKTSAEAARIALKLQKERGELVSIKEIRTHLYDVFKALHSRICVQYPKQHAGRLKKSKSKGELQRSLEVDLSLIFDDLKRDYPRIF